MKQRIYIVEDHEVVRESYVMFLELQGTYEVCGAVETAEAALEGLDDSEADLVLIDISLPGMNGIELVRTLRERGTRTPVLMLTGHDNDTYRQEALAAGATGFVMKQRGPDVLIDAIESVLPPPDEA